MKLALALLVLAWLVPLTPIRRVLPGESFTALILTSVVIVSFDVLGLLA